MRTISPVLLCTGALLWPNLAAAYNSGSDGSLGDFIGCSPDTMVILPPNGVLGEMVLSVGKAAWLAKNGADGVVDISPFTCMNGIVSESVYPKLSKDFGGIPIRNFYFDGTQSDLDRDLGIYMELARGYREKKAYQRKYPQYFAVGA